MRTSMLWGALVSILLVCTATASAAVLLELQPVGGETASYATGMTPDGAWVIGKSLGGTANGFGSLYSTSGDGTTVAFNAGGYTALNLTGICYQTVDGQQVLTVAGNSSTNWRIGIWTGTPGGTWSVKLPADTYGNAKVIQNNFNALASDGGSTNGFYFSYKYSNSNLQIGHGVGTGTVLFGDYRTGVAAADPRQASASGKIVGRAFGGAGGTGVFSYVDGGGNDLIKTTPTGLAGSTEDLAYGIDASGTRVAGSSKVNGVSLPWVSNLSAGTTIALPLLAGVDGSSQSYGMSADGKYIVGQNFVGAERAVMWDVSNANAADWRVWDLTALARSNGILGNFTSLDRAYSFGQKANGDYVVSGYGTTANGQRGFVITFPEPATLSLLALGGLAALRRRRGA